MSHLIPTILCCLWLAALPAAAVGPALPDISGMVRLDGQTYLVIIDAKDPAPETARLGLLRVGDGQAGGGGNGNNHGYGNNGSHRPPVLSYTPLPIRDWPAGQDPPNDLEAGCLDATSPERLLLAEGGFFKGRFGRIFVCRIGRDAEGNWQVAYQAHFQPFPPDVGSNQAFTTPGPRNIEGMASVACGEDCSLLVLGWRGGRDGGGYRPARLVWGTLRAGAARPFTVLGEADLTGKRFRSGERGCADLMVRPAGRGWEVLAAATDDGGDQGPFRSVVYRAGELQLDSAGGLRFRRRNPQLLWTIDGVKVEAIAPPPQGMPGAALCIGTDDEFYGGLWRLLRSER